MHLPAGAVWGAATMLKDRSNGAHSSDNSKAGRVPMLKPRNKGWTAQPAPAAGSNKPSSPASAEANAQRSLDERPAQEMSNLRQGSRGSAAGAAAQQALHLAGASAGATAAGGPAAEKEAPLPKIDVHPRAIGLRRAFVPPKAAARAQS
jgi:hypothetical protein